MNIALLGGAFNPPHLGHLLIARQILDFTDTDEIWLLPNFRQHPPKPVAPFTHRLAMTKLMVQPQVQVSTLEYDHQLDGQTIHVLPHLPTGNTYRFIIGSDQLPAFHLWGQWETLLTKLPFFVFPRYGYPNEPTYTNMTVIHNELLIGTNISSTRIRERIKQGFSPEPFVLPDVAAYIRKEKLYL